MSTPTVRSFRNSILFVSAVVAGACGETGSSKPADTSSAADRPRTFTVTERSSANACTSLPCNR